MITGKADSTSALIEKAGNLFPHSWVERLRKLGHGFTEEGRTIHGISDKEGNQYIDCVSGNGIYNLGRRNDTLCRALMDAVKSTDQGNFPMISVEKARLAERLAAFVPGNLECTVFSVIRGESIDFACKLARGYTGRKELIAVAGSWFGHTGFACSLSGGRESSLYGPLIPEVGFIPAGDIDAAEGAISSGTAAVFIEPVQSENGCIVADADYLRELRQLCSRRGALLVFDETQSGLGRCGSPFVFEDSGISPDVLVIGEALGGGIFPIAATIFTQKLNRFMNKHPMIHLSTFGGADQGCRVAFAALEEYEKRQPWKNAKEQGEKLKKEFLAVRETYPDLIRSVSGTGLLLALELPEQGDAMALCRELAENGVLAIPGEAAKNSVVFRPDLFIDDQTAAEIVEGLAMACKAVTGGERTT